MADPALLTFHDEPFVIDNFPLEIDIGKEHSDRGLIDPPASARPSGPEENRAP
jgi:hypothetical protein